jgi:hypothetical protein
MKKYVKRFLSGCNIVLILALIGSTAVRMYTSTASARSIPSGKDRPLIQSDDDDIAPPINTDSSQNDEPKNLDDPASAHWNATSERDSLTNQPDSGVTGEEPAAEENDNAADEPDNDAEEPSSSVNGDETVLNEAQPQVEEPDPLVNQAEPPLEQPETVVPEAGLPGDTENGGE